MKLCSPSKSHCWPVAQYSTQCGTRVRDMTWFSRLESSLLYFQTGVVLLMASVLSVQFTAPLDKQSSLLDTAVFQCVYSNIGQIAVNVLCSVLPHSLIYGVFNCTRRHYRSWLHDGFHPSLQFSQVPSTAYRPCYCNNLQVWLTLSSSFMILTVLFVVTSFVHHALKIWVCQALEVMIELVLLVICVWTIWMMLCYPT